MRANYNPYFETGDTPGVQGDFGRKLYPANIFKEGSAPETAHTQDIDLLPGFGDLPPGTLVAKIAEPITGRDLYVPYSKVVPGATDSNDFGKIPLLQDCDTSGYIYISIEHSYRIAVGEKFRLVDADTASLDLGAITAIDRTSSADRAKITVTNAGTASFTVANGACISHQTKTTTPFTEASGVLQGGVRTGVGKLAKGGQGVMVYGNAVLEYNMLLNSDSGAVTNLSGRIINSRYLYLN